MPVAVGGQNWLYRTMIVDLVVADPAWKEGVYREPAAGHGNARGLLKPARRPWPWQTNKYPTQSAVDRFVEEEPDHDLRRGVVDVNDPIFTWNASRDYDPVSRLGVLSSALTAFHPPELGMLVLEKAIAQQMRPGLGKAVTLPISNETIGHSSYISARLWVDDCGCCCWAGRAPPTSRSEASRGKTAGHN